MKLKTYSTREFRQLLCNNGFEFVGSKGDHFKYKRNGKLVVINKDINKCVCQRLIKENNLVV